MTNPRFEPEFITPFSLAKGLGMTDAPNTVNGILDRARQMLAEEREGRIAAEVDLDECRAALDRAINLAVLLESGTV